MLTQVTTESGSVYIFDDMAMMFTRVAGEGAAALQGDSAWTQFANVTKLEEGHPMEILWIDGQDLKTRITTPVLNVQVIPVTQDEYERGIADEVLPEDTEEVDLPEGWDMEFYDIPEGMQEIDFNPGEVLEGEVIED